MTNSKVAEIADALVRSVREHGAPNGFSPGWLFQQEGCRVRPLVIGQLAPEVCYILQRKGWAIGYSNRSFRVESTPND